MKKTIIRSILGGFIFVISILIFGYLSLKVLAGITKVSNGTVLSVEMWNNLVDQVFQINGTSLYYLTGNVGIGVNNPTEKLDINGSVKITNDIKGIQETSFTTTNTIAGWTQQHGKYSKLGDKTICLKVRYYTSNASYEIASGVGSYITDWPTDLTPADHGQIMGHCATADGTQGHSYACSLIISGGKLFMTSYRAYTARSVMINTCYMKN